LQTVQARQSFQGFLSLGLATVQLFLTEGFPVFIKLAGISTALFASRDLIRNRLLFFLFGVQGFRRQTDFLQLAFGRSCFESAR